MGTYINKGAAALLIFIEENAPGGHCTAAQGYGSAVINIAQLAVLTAFFKVKGIPSPAALVTDGKQLAGPE